MLFHRVRMLAVVLAASFAISCAPPVAGTRIAAGAEVEGALTAPADNKNNAPIQAVYALQGRQGEQYVVTLASDAFDAYLQVRGPGTLSQDNDDDASGSGTLNSRLAFTFPEDGTAQIIVTSFDRRGAGAYRLSVQRAEAPAAVAANAGAAATVGQVMEGALAQGDSQLDSGEFVDTYPLTGTQGQQLDIRLSSTAFDPYVAITGPNGFREFNDDDVQGNSRNARLIVALPAAGQYTVHVTSYQPGESGAYRLEINPTDQVAANSGLAGAAGAQGDLSLGQTMQGELAQGDATLRSGEFVDTYRFAGEAGQRVSIEMQSTAFDAYLMLVAPSGAQEDNDDGVQGQPNARLETVLTESGQYAIAATSYRPGETGAYTVTLQRGAAAATQVASAAGTARRVFAVMVGISDYPGSGNDLPFTAEDARKLQQTLQRNNVLASDSAVLIDAQATRASVRAAFQRVAAAAGPDDLFLFFYSGHGNQVRTTPSATEPDGKDETIELYDGAMRDDEVAQLFQQVHSRTALLVLDSCFSGGFARDVVSHPGVMGLFSSEEDLTSAVADKFQAGGYLSHFIQTGLSGGADENRDRVITAGELSAYVRRQFASEASNVSSSTMAGGRNYQFPVVDRGGVDIDSPLLAIRA